MKRLFLRLCSLLYRLLTTIRNYLFDLKILSTYKSKLPVICVGNLAVGGSGKSPFAQYLAGELSNEMRVAILSRGYRGKIRGPHQVHRQDTAVTVGDEAVMHYRALLKKEVPVIIARSRVQGLRYIEKHNLADIVILDDGFQHRWLARDLNLLLLDVSSEKILTDLKTNLLLPAGCLRESRAQAFSRANAIIVINRSGVEIDKPDLKLFTLTDIPSFEVLLVPAKFHKLSSDEYFPLQYFKNSEGSAITAIAKPEAFFLDLMSLGIKLAVKKSFRDHSLFYEPDFVGLKEPIFTTAKDCVKLDQLVVQGKELYVLEQSVVLRDSAAFFGFLHRSLNL